MTDKSTAQLKKEVGRLRSEVRKLGSVTKSINPFTGIVSGNYWTQTGMPWVSGEGRKAVLTEYFWQPIRGQPRRVDTNELRQFAQTFWVNACVKTIIDEVSSLDWDIVPKDGYEYEWVEEGVNSVKEFLRKPNKNCETFSSILRAWLKDLLEIDAGVIIKVFDMNSYDFDEIEPKSGAPMLKPLGQRRLTELYVRDGASFLKEIDKFGFVKGYWQYSYQIPAHPMWFNRDEIVYCSEQPRSMSCYGYARTQAVMDIIKSLHYSTLYNKRLFEETTIPDGALSLLDTNDLEMKSFMNWWNGEFKAQPHKLAVINKDVKWQPFNVTNRELEFLETQKWYFNMVISAFGLTPTELGLTQDVNKSTSATQAEVVKRKGIRPFLKLFEGFVNQELMPEFQYEGIEFQFIYDDPAEKSARLANWKSELDMGVKTPNEVRLEMGLEPVAGGDVPKSMNQPGVSPGIPGKGGEEANYRENLDREQSKSLRKQPGNSKQDSKPSEQKPESSQQNLEVPNAPLEERTEDKITDRAIKEIVAQILGANAEGDEEGVNEASADRISAAISAHLTSLGVENEVLDVSSTDPDGKTGEEHKVVYVAELDVVIDTQTRQEEGGKSKPFDERQIIFLRQDYKRLGFSINPLPSSGVKRGPRDSYNEVREAVRNPYGDNTRMKADTKTIPLKELIREHEKLVAVLRSGDLEKLRAEAEEQAKELEAYKREARTS